MTVYVDDVVAWLRGREWLVRDGSMPRYHAVLCDPPYGLSNQSRESVVNRIADALLKVMLPNLSEFNSRLAQDIDLAGIPLDGSALSRRKIAPIIKSWVSVPERPVDLDSEAIRRQIEIDASHIASGGWIADSELSNEVEAAPGEFLGDYILDLRDTADCARRDLIGGAFAEFGNGFLSVPITPVLLPETDSPLLRFLHKFSGGFRDYVGATDNTLGESQAAPSVLASGGTVNTFMLRFDMRRGALEFVPTYRTRQGYAGAPLASPKLIGAITATSSLPPMLKPIRVRLVLPTAHGTYPGYFHLWMLPNPFAQLRGILPQGGFMGKDWDSTLPDPEVWRLLLSFVYPGAVLLAFGGTRTYHRLAAGLEDAGWEVGDSLVWMYGSGFPKSHDISKALDREAGAEREVLGMAARSSKCPQPMWWEKGDTVGKQWRITAPATPLAARWSGYGTALKPAYESIVLARAPRNGHTYAALAREFGTGALNVDGGRIQFANNEPYSIDERCRPNTRGTRRKPSVVDYVHEIAAVNVSALGRWPANVILGCACAGDEHDADCPVRVLGEQSGESGHSHWPQSDANVFGTIAGQERKYDGAGTYDNIPGTAARFFFKAKAAAWEREAGLTTRSHHPTMKPIALTEYLARLLLPPPLQEPRRLLVPFAGSGSEMIGAHLAGWDVVHGIEQSAEYADIARARLAWWSQFSSYEQARSAAGADEREAAEREQARALGVEQLALFDSGGETW